VIQLELLTQLNLAPQVIFAQVVDLHNNCVQPDFTLLKTSPLAIFAPLVIIAQSPVSMIPTMIRFVINVLQASLVQKGLRLVILLVKVVTFVTEFKDLNHVKQDIIVQKGRHQETSIHVIFLIIVQTQLPFLFHVPPDIAQ